MFTNPLLLIAGIVAIGLVFVVVPIVIDVYRQYQHRKVVTCPQTHGLAEVTLKTRLGALGAAFGKPILRVKSCSLWPKRIGCDDITNDPDSAIRNVGTYRIQLKGAKQLGLFINYLQGGREHVEKNRKRGQPTPVAIVIGAEPVIGLVSVTRLPQDLDEFAVAGALRGGPVGLVRCVTSDLEVPAAAEIVIEGTIANELEEEGPFGEYTGYMGPKSISYRVDVQCLTHRETPIFQAISSQMPPSESSCIRSIGRESALQKHLVEDLGLPVQDVHLFESGGAAAYLVISIKKSHPAQPRTAMCGAWSFAPQFGKLTVVVDYDIEIRDPNLVNWALSFRVQPEKDAFIMPGTAAVQLDPSQARDDVLQQDSARRVSSKIGIDATHKHAFSAVAVPPQEHLERVRRDWQSYGFGNR